MPQNPSGAPRLLILRVFGFDRNTASLFRQVALRYLDGRQLTEGLLNHIEVAVRAFDPCLSCATHALGKMPFNLELIDADGECIDQLVRSSIERRPW